MNIEEVNARLESMIDEFNTFRQNSSLTHKELHEKLNALYTNFASISTKLEHIEEILTKMQKQVEDVRYKPAKRWDDLIGNVIWCIVGAVLLAMLAKVGL